MDAFDAFVGTPLHNENGSPPVVLSESDWLERESVYQHRMDQWLVPHTERRSRHEADPVHDFLFEYYGFRPSHLRRWSPGIGVILEGSKAAKFLNVEGFVPLANGVGLDTARFPAHLHTSTRWIRDLLVSTRDSPPHFGCSGMHEWAMVYGTEPVRHVKTPLRFSRNVINSIVEDSVLTCTHYDAFRFFTESATPLNTHSLKRETMAETEQPACLHTNMDLFRWVMKRMPWIRSELVADTFFLAAAIREIDMRASPYDLSPVGLEPIRVETTEGKREYREHQKIFMERASGLRDELIGEYDRLLSAIRKPE
jgi:hypothetical protein